MYSIYQIPQNFFMQALRSSLDAVPDKNYVLSIAVGAAKDTIEKSYQMQEVSR